MTQKEMLTSAFPPTHNSSLPTDNNRRSTLEPNPQLLKINAAHELSVADKPLDRKAHRLFQFQGSPLTSVRRLQQKFLIHSKSLKHSLWCIQRWPENIHNGKEPRRVVTSLAWSSTATRLQTPQHPVTPAHSRSRSVTQSSGRHGDRGNILKQEASHRSRGAINLTRWADGTAS